jgi:putative glutamine amidotransferase
VERPRIALTCQNPERAADPGLAALKNRRYADALERHGATPVPLDDRATPEERRAALEAMDGLVITGGGDMDPSRYGEPMAGSHPPDPGRDALDEEAITAAWERNVPVLGICRGLQVLNILRGGSLVQHIDGHEASGSGGPPVMHPIEVLPGTLLANALEGAQWPVVNSYHHQAVTPERLAPGLRASALAAHGDETLVEGLESTDPERWVVGIQCHPERNDYSPPVLEQLWDAFLGATRRRRSGGT